MTVRACGANCVLSKPYNPDTYELSTPALPTICDDHGTTDEPHALFRILSALCDKQALDFSFARQGMTFDIRKIRIGVVGLGYVDLPLAVQLGRKYPTIGFDVKTARIKELESGKDSTREVSGDELTEATQLGFTSDAAGIKDCNFYIVTVPTPIGDGNRPLLTPLKTASIAIGAVLKPGDIVVYESRSLGKSR